MYRIAAASLLLTMAVCGAAGRADEPLARATAAVAFSSDIQPLLAKRCLLCHGPDEAEAGLRLDTQQAASALLESGQRGIVPGDAQASEVLRRVTAQDADQRMPPDGPPLADAEIELLRQWIDQGGKYQQHWAYQPVQAAPPREAANDPWIRNPIDAFVLAQLQESGLSPSPEADRATLIKRVHYDLIGLPPTPWEVDDFINDDSPDAFERLVDRLLSSEHFGQRWGRHWLDMARYADSDGYEKDRPRPNAWRYRDWVIDAINQDMPLDRFTIEQLAGDLLPEAGPMEKLATAFHRQTLTNTEGGVDQEEFRVEATFDRTETTAAVWMALTLGCARCHTHKYDQISQHEYYQLFAFFNNAAETDIEVPTSEVAAAPQPPMMSAAVLTAKPRVTQRLQRGDFLQPAEEVTPAALAVLTRVHPLQSRAPGTPPDRLDLARWLVDADHPLTARVAVNQVWARLLGRGIVATVDDFGVRGEPPTHPELLDWLAAHFSRTMRWSRKALIRTVVTSATYRQSSDHRAELQRIDPSNRLLARQSRLRVEAEIVRDLHLAVGGLLSHKLGGPSVFPPLPAGVTELSYANNFKWTTSHDEDRYRRGLYTFFKRTSPHPTLISFDCPDSNTTRLQREASNTPLQALITLNNDVFTEAAQGMARRVIREAGSDDDAERIRYALRLCIARQPAEAEIGRFEDLLHAAREHYRANGDDARALTQRHAAEDLSAAENAAWVATLRIVMNLDEFIVRD